MKNDNLHKAKAAKNDEFYTQISDIEKELRHYKEYFRDKVILCNCDDPEYSNFWKYFQLNFEFLGLKKLISTHYEADKPSYKLEMFGKDNIVKTPLKQNGDFRSPECIELLKKADIVCTNEPFSLTREYVAQLMAYNKDFLIIFNKNSVMYREIFPLIKDNKVWLGYTSPKKFLLPDGTTKAFGNIGWLTNLKTFVPKSFLSLNPYIPSRYPRYNNFPAAINVNKLSEIPDFDGIMGVPITFLNAYNPNQFQILGTDSSYYVSQLGIQPIGQAFLDDFFGQGGTGHYTPNMYNLGYYNHDGKAVFAYKRILIKQQKNNESIIE